MMDLGCSVENMPCYGSYISSTGSPAAAPWDPDFMTASPTITNWTATAVPTPQPTLPPMLGSHGVGFSSLPTSFPTAVPTTAAPTDSPTSSPPNDIVGEGVNGASDLLHSTSGLLFARVLSTVVVVAGMIA